MLNFNDTTIAEMYEKLLFDDSEEKYFEYFSNGTRKHSFESLKPYFEQFFTFKIIDTALFFEPHDRCITHKLLSFMLIHENNFRRLPFTKNTLEKFYEVSTSNNNNIPYEFIMESLISIKWKHVFKDLYRCIEALYAWPMIDKLLQESGDCCNCSDVDYLVETIEKTLGWRATEREALKLLLQRVPVEIIDSFINIFNGTDPKWKTWEEAIETRKKKIESITNLDEISEIEKEIERYDNDIHITKANYIGNQLYDLRNSLVHFRKALKKEVSLSDEQWNVLTVSMLAFIMSIYDHFHEG